MAGCDYGGYVYRDGTKIDDVERDIELGDGALRIVLEKGWRIGVFNFFKRHQLNPTNYLVNPQDGDISDYGELDTDNFLDKKPATIAIDGHKITAFWRTEREDYAPEGASEYDAKESQFLYVKLEQPDGVVWTGFSGYGVGKGLESCGYGFSTEKRVKNLHELFANGE